MRKRHAAYCRHILEGGDRELVVLKAGTDPWHQARARDVTASVVGALPGFNVHQYLTPFHLWALKTGRLPRSSDPAESPEKRRGRLMEPVHRNLIKMDNPTWTIIDPGFYVRAPAVRLGATPDLLVEDRDGRRGVIQMKSVEASVFRRQWMTPDGPEPPMWIVLQVLTEAWLCRAEFAFIDALVMGFGLERHGIEVPLHVALIDRLIKETAEFWNLVASGEAVEPNWGRDGETIEAMFRSDDGSYGDLPRDAADMVPVREYWTGVRDDAEQKISAIDAMVKHAMGDHAGAYLPDGRLITWQTRKRKPSWSPGGESRVLQYPRRKE